MQRVVPEVGAQAEQESRPPPAVRPDASPRAGRGEGGADQRIPGIRPLRVGRDHQFRLGFQGHVLGRVHRQVGLAGEQRRFQRAHEDALARRGARRAHVARAHHRHQFDLEAQAAQRGLDQPRLDQGQGRAASGDAQGAHDSRRYPR